LGDRLLLAEAGPS